MTVALIGTIGTCMANLHDYYIVNYLSGLRRARRFKETAFYRRSVGWFERAPFLTLAAASFIPIPIDVVQRLRWQGLVSWAPPPNWRSEVNNKQVLLV